MSGSGAKVLVEGFAADAHVARDGRLAFTGGNAAVQIGNHLIRERPFPPPIGAALPSDRNAFALPFADQGALELSKRTHDREHQIGHRGVLPREGQAFLLKLDPDTSLGEALDQLAQVIQIAGQPIHAVDDDGIAFAGESEQSLKLGAVDVLARCLVGEGPICGPACKRDPVSGVIGV